MHVSTDGHATGNFLSDLFVKFDADLYFFFVVVVALCFTSIIEFNPNHTVFRITDCLIISRAHLSFLLAT